MPVRVPPMLAPCGRFNNSSYLYNLAVPWADATDITFEAWVKVDWVTNTVGSANTIMQSGSSLFVESGDRGIYFLRSTGGEVQLVAYAQGAPARNVSARFVSSYVGKTIHVIATFSNTNGIKLYVDGLLVAGPSAACNGTLASVGASARFYIGTDGSGTFRFPGRIGGVKVWTRELSAAEVLDRYTVNRNDTAMRASLLFDVPLTDGAGSTAADQSGNGLTMTWSGPLWDERGIIRPKMREILLYGTDLPNCCLDLDVERLVGYVDGDPVTSATNFADATNPLVSSGANRPVYKVNIINGKPVLRFTGAALSYGVLTGTKLGVTAGFSLYALFSTTSLGAAANEGRIIGNEQHCTVTHYQGDSKVYGYVGSPGVNNVAAGRAIGVTTLLSFHWDGTTTEPYSMVERFEGSFQAARKSTLAPSNTADYYVGLKSDATNPWTGDLLRLLMYRGRHTDMEIGRVEEMLARQGGI